MTIVRTCAIAVACLAGTATLHAQSGLAWDLHGSWQSNHTQAILHKGDAVAPGALLTADAPSASIVILLPDGQRLLFECHDAHVCAQGFRIPALIARPDDDALELFAAVQRVIHSGPSFSTSARTATAESEAVIPMQEDGTILLRQALAALPPGEYQLKVQRIGDVQLTGRDLKWSGPRDETRLPLANPGVYRIQFFGNLGVERLRVMILAASHDRFPSAQKSFSEARKDLDEWNETFPGWPTHAWLQLYLEALSQEPGQEGITGKQATSHP
jgi:hypothetical protein